MVESELERLKRTMVPSVTRPLADKMYVTRNITVVIADTVDADGFDAVIGRHRHVRERTATALLFEELDQKI